MKRKRIIFDTNALISAFLLKKSVSSLAFDSALMKGEIITSEVIHKEFVTVFFRNKFDNYVTFANRLELVESLESQLLFWPENLIKPLQICRDPHDDIYLELAVASHAFCIVTGDRDLLSIDPFYETRIVTASDFLTLF